MEQKKIEEFVEKAQQAKSPKEAETAVKECGLERTDEALADDALDQVAGGSEGKGQIYVLMCSKCIKCFSAEQLELRDGHYYCPDCGKLLM